MLTRQILQPLSTIERIQRSDDGYFNATHFLSHFLKTTKEEKRMSEFLKLKSTVEFKEHLITSEKIVSPIKSSTKGTWMHPFVFIDFAMWLSLDFKTQAIKWVYDGLIFQRNQAGDFATQLAGVIMKRYIEVYNCKPAPMIYMNEFRYLKELVGINERNTASEIQLQTLNVLQKLDIKLIQTDIGKVSRYKQLKQLSEALLD